MSEENMQANGQSEGQDLSEILQVRRSKLKDLQEKNNDPFKVVKYDVMHSTKHILDNFETLEGPNVICCRKNNV